VYLSTIFGNSCLNASCKYSKGLVLFNELFLSYKFSTFIFSDFDAATSLKNKAYKNMLAKKNTRRAREEYQRRKNEEKKIHRRKKKEAWKGLMEEAGRQKETRKFYRKVNIIRKGYKPRIRMCKEIL
jgi:hypothetical protein